MAKPIIDPLFIAVPELAFKVDGLRRLRDSGAISAEEYRRIAAGRQAVKRGQRAAAASMSGTKIINRLLAVGPELITIESVNLLRTLGAITEPQVYSLRIAVRSLSAGTKGGLPANKAQIFSRLVRVMGVQFGNDQIDLWRVSGLISWKEADRMHGMLNSGTLLKESLAKARRAKNLTDALILLGEIPLSKDLVRNLVRAEIISAKVGEVYLASADLGVKQWKVFSGARAAEGYRQRLLLALTGTMNRELLTFAQSIGVINARQRSQLLIAEQVARQVNQNMLESLTKRKYRVKPGEAPIKTFARASRVDDGELLRLLSKSAQQSRKEALALASRPGVGASTRAGQYNMAARGLHGSMRAMWEGVGYLTILGESKVAEAAAESAIAMQKNLLKHGPKNLEDSLLWQAKAGVDSYISRAENTLNLSRRVYKNMSFYEGKVDEVIKVGLLQGKSAAELAKDVHRFIDPKTPGGSSYAAMRLARTEINNAFHFSTIRFTREQPWTRGYDWNVSGSHPKPDVCDDYEDMSPFSKGEVPEKPHPNCFCYITTVQMSEDEFIGAYKSGRFNSYMKQVSSGQAYGSGNSGDPVYAARVASQYAGDWGLDQVAESFSRTRNNP